MSWKSVFKKIGKVALKVAPYAAMAIPGIGPAAMIAMQAGLGAANAKASGANWKQSLLAGGIGAGTGAIGAKLPTGGGTGSKFLAGLVGKGATKSAIGATGAAVGNVGIGMGAGALTNRLADQPTYRNTSGFGYQPGMNVGQKDQESEAPYGRASTGSRSIFSREGRESRGISTRTAQPRQEQPAYMPEGGFSYEEHPLHQYDQSSPNLALALHQGREDAKKRYASQ